MSSSSSNNASNSRDDARSRKEELELVKDFWTVVQKHLETIQRRESPTTNGSSGSKEDSRGFTLEDEERKILYEINNFGILPAAAAGLTTLFVLRNIRPAMLRRFRGKKPPTNTGGGGGSSPHVTNSPFQQGPPPGGGGGNGNGGDYKQLQPSLFLRTFGWSMDLISSFMVAVGASIMTTDHEVIAGKITTLPLVSGRGRVAEELCPPVLNFLQEIRRDESTREVLENASSTNLKQILAFCQNCQRRGAYENRLRQEKGLASDAPVSIPPPGVPVDDNNGDSDTSLLAGWIEQDDVNQQDGTNSAAGGFANDDFYDPSQEQSKGNEYGNGGGTADNHQDWADSMVSDREQEDSRR
jgi:hypothetical protein